MESAAYDILDPPEIRVCGIRLYPVTLGHYLLIHKYDLLKCDNIKKFILSIRICSQPTFEGSREVIRKSKKSFFYKLRNAWLGIKLAWSKDKALHNWKVYKVLLNSPPVFEPIQDTSGCSYIELLRNYLLRMGYDSKEVMDVPLVIATNDVAISKGLRRGPSEEKQAHILKLLQEADKCREANQGKENKKASPLEPLTVS